LDDFQHILSMDHQSPCQHQYDGKTLLDSHTACKDTKKKKKASL
jgi:hypothetical protein